MYVATVDIGADGAEIDRILDPAALIPAESGRSLALGPVHLVGWIRRLGYGFGFHGRLETAVELACSRCLEGYRLDLDLPFDLIYRQPIAGRLLVGEDVQTAPPDPGDPAVSVLDDGRIDLAQLVREQIYLALPLKPLCRSECRGLCPRCGARRDDETCGCRTQAVDPRWAALEKWKKRL